MRNRRGFTLLEVLVATAILAIALVSMMTAQGNTLLTSYRAELLTQATMLARQKMAEVELEVDRGVRRGEFPEERTESDQFEEPYSDFRWEYRIRRVELPAPAMGDEASFQAQIAKRLTEEISRSVRELRVVIFWEEAEKEQSIEVVTHVVQM